MTRISRRRFLGMLGAGAVASTTSASLLPGAAHAQAPTGARQFVLREDRFGRIFPACRHSQRRVRLWTRPCATSASPAAAGCQGPLAGDRSS